VIDKGMMLVKSCLIGKGPDGNFSRNLSLVAIEFGAISWEANAFIALVF
jgi:hypothetical protein